MKLLFCRECGDIRRLRSVVTSCACGRSAGRYLPDDVTAEYRGPGCLLGIANSSFEAAVRRHREGGGRSELDACVLSDSGNVVRLRD